MIAALWAWLRAFLVADITPPEDRAELAKAGRPGDTHSRRVTSRDWLYSYSCDRGETCVMVLAATPADAVEILLAISTGGTP